MSRRWYALSVPETPRVSEQLAALDDDWFASYALEERDGVTIISGIKITPRADAFRRWPPTPGTAPSTGLLARTLRGTLRLGPDVIRRLTRMPAGLDLSRMGPALREYLETPLPPPRRSPGRPGSSGRPDGYYLEIAVAYSEAGTRHPNVAAAKQTGYSREYVRDAVAECRRRDLLTKALPGRSGGELTDKAKRLLERAS